MMMMTLMMKFIDDAIFSHAAHTEHIARITYRHPNVVLTPRVSVARFSHLFLGFVVNSTASFSTYDVCPHDAQNPAPY